MHELESQKQLKSARMAKAPVPISMSFDDLCNFDSMTQDVFDAITTGKAIPHHCVNTYHRFVEKYKPHGLPKNFPYLEKWNVSFFKDLCLMAARQYIDRVY